MTALSLRAQALQRTIDDQRVNQRDRALKQANRIRVRRKEIKEDLAAGGLDLIELVRDPPEEILTAEIGEVLRWKPGIGPWRAAKILHDPAGHQAICLRTVRVDHLSQRTRERICRRIDETAPVLHPGR